MKLLLALLCAVAYHYCDGYPITDADEISEELLIKNDSSVEYLFDTTNVTSSNDSLLLHVSIKGGIKSIKGKIGNIKGKIGSKTGSGSGIGGGRYIGGIRTRTNSGSGVKDPENAKWALLGIGSILLVTLGGLALYYWVTRKKKPYSACELQQASKM